MNRKEACGVAFGLLGAAIVIGMIASVYRKQALIRTALDPTARPHAKALTANQLQSILPDLIEIHRTNFNYCRSHPAELPIKEFNARIGSWNAILEASSKHSETATAYITKHLAMEPYGDEVENAQSFTQEPLPK